MVAKLKSALKYDSRRGHKEEACRDSGATLIIKNAHFDDILIGDSNSPDIITDIMQNLEEEPEVAFHFNALKNEVMLSYKVRYPMAEEAFKVFSGIIERLISAQRIVNEGGIIRLYKNSKEVRHQLEQSMEVHSRPLKVSQIYFLFYKIFYIINVHFSVMQILN